jgi:hypothetical protein
MWRKRDLIIASLVIIALISSSVGFYELGLNQGKDIGYQNGFSQGSSSVLVQMGTMISLKQNSTVIIDVFPFFLPYNVTLVYSFYVDNLLGQNETVDMTIYGVGDSGIPQLLFNTGYVNNDSGIKPLSTKNIEPEIIFTANPNNNAAAVLQFTSPLRLAFN